MKGRGEIITILCMSVFLICILYAMTYGGIVKAEELEKQPEEAGEKTEVDIEEELRWAEEVKKILKDIGVGFCDETEDKQEEDKEETFDQTDEKKIQSIGVYAAARAGETVYTKAIERGIGAIDVVDYNDPNWPVLQHWNEGRLGTKSGESLYCTNPTLKFQEGNKTAVDASKRYNKQTIQMIAAMFYYYDKNKCNGVSSNYDYLLKQCAVWWIMNEVHHWYGDMVQIETGNNVACGNGHWISAHKSEYYQKGIAWAKENYKYFPDAYGVIYEGNGQPLSKWGGTYQPTGTGRLKKVSANTSVTEKNSCYSLEGAEYGVYSSPTLSGASRAGTFRTDAAGNSSSVALNAGTYYVKELKAPKGYERNVTEYEVIDYIQSLNTHQTEGAQTAQEKEGAYSEYRVFVEELRTHLQRNGKTGQSVEVTSTKADNSFEIKGLPYGYYIIDEVTEVKGTNSAASLCMVSTANPEMNLNIKSDYPVVTKKIREDDDQDKVGNQGWNDLADFEIGQTVPYRYESNMPDVNGYNTYYYAWHDVMSEALTFKKDSVAIRIYESSNARNYYELKEGEFEVKEAPGGGDTFQVIVSDMKKIIDREFNRKNEAGENKYGQKIVLTYQATLNEKAAKNTGRPGFENDVRLEFSNDPDSAVRGSTGYTPWDTVVCFTYKINALKSNNHGQSLENARFRLYSDAGLKNEVYVKQGEGGYIVINRDSLGGNDHTGGKQPENAVEMKSGQDGTFVIYGLDSGTYYLKETEAPAGYRLLTEPIVVNIKASFPNDRNAYVKGDGKTDKGLKKLETSAQIKEFINGNWKESEVSLTTNEGEGSANLTVINTVGKKLPVTGSSAAVICITTGSVLVLAGAMRRNRKNAKEKQ